MTVATTPAVEPVAVRLQQAISLYRSGDMPAAEALFCDILRDDPGNPHALHLLGLIAHKRHDLEMAERLIERAVTLAPHSRAQHNLGVVKQQRGDIDGAIATYRQALALEPDYLEAATNLIFALDLHPYATPDLLLAERRRFAEAFCDPLTRMAAPHANDLDPDRKLRVGYVSSDFREHSAAMSFGTAIRGHDPGVVEVYLYSTAERHDHRSEPFKSRADVWCEVAALNPAELAQAIREDGIDILVDLNGFSKGERLLTFALKPAPVQISAWGYCTGTGMAAMDYLMADDVAIPPAFEGYYRERILRLPCLLGYDPGPYPDLVAGPPEARNGYRTYGYLGRAMKLNDPTLACWARILREDPSGRLILKSDQYTDRSMRDRIAHRLLALGVDLGRVEVQGGTTRAEHLAAHNEIDVALDPFPQGGGMTTMDACLMGVPTVALEGRTVPGRTAASIMTVLGHEGWVASGEDQYVALATQQHATREALRDALLDSVICDRRGYARAVEAAYYHAWQAWCDQQRERVA